MTDLVAESAAVYRDYETDGVPASGLHDPVKAEIRALWADLAAKIAALPGIVGPAVAPGILTDAEATAAALFAEATAAIQTTNARAKALLERAAPQQNDLDTFLAAMRAADDAIAAARSAARNAAGVAQTQSDLVDTNRAVATLARDIYARFGSTAADISELAAVMASADEAEANKTDYIGVAKADGPAANVDAFVSAMRTGAAVDQAARGAAVNAAGIATNAQAILGLNGTLASLSTQVYARFGDVSAAIVAAISTAAAYADSAVAAYSLTAAATYQTIAGMSAYATAATVATLANTVATGDAASAVKTDYIGASRAPAGAADNVDAFVASMRNGDTLAQAQKAAAINAAGVATNTQSLSDLAKSVGSLSTTVFATFGDVKASVAVNTSAIATLNGYAAAAYGVTLDVNGYVNGFQIINGGSAGSSAFNIRADKFSVIQPGYGGQTVFSIDNVNGTPQVSIKGTLIADQTVNTPSIKDNAVSSSSISTGSGNSGTASCTVQAGSRTFIEVSYAGADVIFGGVGANLAIYINGSLYTSQGIISITISGSAYYFSTIYTIPYTVSSTGTLSAYCTTIGQTGMIARCVTKIISYVK